MHYAIIAAGEGSRLVQEGVALPKPLVDLDGRPMIKRLIDIMLDNNAESIAVIVNEQMTQVRQYLESLKLDTEFLLVVKTTPSSMHSFWEVSRAFPESGKFVLTTVDTIFRADDFATYVEAFENAPAGTDGYMGVTSFIDDEKPLYVPKQYHYPLRVFHRFNCFHSFVFLSVIQILFPSLLAFTTGKYINSTFAGFSVYLPVNLGSRGILNS